MIENIALILQVHEGFSRSKAKDRALRALQSLQLGHIASLRYDACSEKDIFSTQLIRACLKKDATIVIDQPFIFLDEEIDLSFLLDALDRLLISYQDVLIIDLSHQKSHYKESACLIEE